MESVCAGALAFDVYVVNAGRLTCSGAGFFGDLLVSKTVATGAAWVQLGIAVATLQRSPWPWAPTWP